MLRPPIKVKSMNMPEYSDGQDHLKYTSVSSDKDTLPRVPSGSLPLGLSRNLGAADNVPRLDPLKRPYARMMRAETKRMDYTWTRPFNEDSSLAGRYVTYGDEPVIKKWNRPMGDYEDRVGEGIPRQYYPLIPDFVPTATSDIFTSESGKLRPPFARGVLADTSVGPAARPKDNGTGLGDLWSDIVASGNTLLKVGGDIFTTYQAGQIAKAQSQIVQAQAQAAQAAAAQTAMAKSTLWNYFPWIIGLSGGALLLSLVLRGKKK